MGRPALLVALVGTLALASSLAPAGCNLIFGIRPGESATDTTAGGGGTGQSGSTGTNGGTGGTSGSGASTTGGGTSTGTGGQGECPAERIPECHPGGGGGAVCDPIAISEMATGYTIGLAMVGDYLHWANGAGKVVRVKFDGSPDSLFGNGQDSVFLAASPENVYYTDWNDGVIRGATLDPAHTLFDVAAMTGMDPMMPRGYLGRIALHGGDLYFVGQDPNAVWTAPADGSQVYATKVADKVDGADNPDVSNGVATDGEHVYWTDAGKVWRVLVAEIPGGTPEPFATDVGAGDVVVDDERVYWTSGGGVASKLKDGTSPTFWPTGNRARSLLLEGTFVYWTELGGRVVRADKGAGMETAVVVANGPPEAYGIAADCGAVYWSTFNFNYGTVYKVRKPGL